jgi:riboflavin synthase
MFTGIVLDVGSIVALHATGDDCRLRVQTRLAARLQPGGSIAVNGACLTVTDLSDTDFGADVSAEIWSRHCCHRPLWEVILSAVMSMRRVKWPA